MTKKIFPSVLLCTKGFSTFNVRSPTAVVTSGPALTAVRAPSVWLWRPVGKTSLVFGDLLLGWQGAPAHSVHPLPLTWNQTLLQGSLTHSSENFLKWTLEVHKLGLGCSLRLVLSVDEDPLFVSFRENTWVIDISNSYLGSHLNFLWFKKFAPLFSFVENLVPNDINNTMWSVYPCSLRITVPINIVSRNVVIEHSF